MPPADVPSLLCTFAFYFYLFIYCPAVSSGSTPAKGKASSSPSIMKYMAPKLLAPTQRAADRRFVLCSAINLRPESMRYDDGYEPWRGDTPHAREPLSMSKIKNYRDFWFPYKNCRGGQIQENVSYVKSTTLAPPSPASRSNTKHYRSRMIRVP